MDNNGENNRSKRKLILEGKRKVVTSSDSRTYRHLPLKPVARTPLGDITNHSDVDDVEFPCPSTTDKYVDVGDPVGPGSFNQSIIDDLNNDKGPFLEYQTANVKVKLIGTRTKDPQTYNTPTVK
ncbi:hypothetical protein V2J09_003991 [Rumex salicifolius]